MYKNLFEYICEKLYMEHHDYLEEYVAMIGDAKQKEKIQLYSNMSRILFNFGINKKIGYLEQFVSVISNNTSRVEEIRGVAEELVEEVIEKYVYGKVKERQVALDKQLKVIDIKKSTHMRTLLAFIEESLLATIIKKGESETRFLRKLLEFEKFSQFKELVESTSLSLEEVDRIILQNVRNSFKKYQITQIKEYIKENFKLLKLKNPTRRQEKAFFKLACLLSSPLLNMSIPLQQLRKKEKIELLRDILKIFSPKPEVLAQIDVFAIHRYFSKFDHPEEDYLPYQEESFLRFLRDYGMKLKDIDRVVQLIEILKREKSPLVADLCHFLVTEFSELSSSQRKRFTQLGLLECQDPVLLSSIISLIHNSDKHALTDKTNIPKKDIESPVSQDRINPANGKTDSNVPHPPVNAASRFFSMISNSISGVVGGSSMIKEAIKESLQNKQDAICLANTEIVEADPQWQGVSNEKKLKKALHDLFDEIQDIIAKKNQDDRAGERKRLFQLFCKLITRDPIFQPFYIIALNKNIFELDLISEIFMKMLKNNYIVLNAPLLIQYVLKICIYRLSETPKSSIFQSQLTKQSLKDIYLPYILEKYPKSDPNRKIFDRFYEAFILINQLHYFTNYITKGNEHKFLFDKAYKNSKIGQMIQETGNLDIFENEPEIFKMEDFNTKELLISSIVCELRNNNLQKCLSLWRKIVALTKSEEVNRANEQVNKVELLSFGNNRSTMSSVADNAWLDCFRKIYERSKNLHIFVDLLDQIMTENKEIFDRVVERKSFQHLKSLCKVTCDVDISKYVKFENLFRTGGAQVKKTAVSNEKGLEDLGIASMNQRACQVEEQVMSSLKEINKKEIRQEVADYNVFVLARVLGHFMENSDSLIYYIYAKKLLRQEQSIKNSLCGSEIEAAEMMVDRISSIPFLSAQRKKLGLKCESNEEVLKRYVELLRMLGEREEKLVQRSLVYGTYNSSGMQQSAQLEKRQLSESVYLRMIRHISCNNSQLQEKRVIWNYFDGLLSEDSANLLDCSECKSLINEYLTIKMREIISIYALASVQFRIHFQEDIVKGNLDKHILEFCNNAPLRKGLLNLLERMQLNMENVDQIISDVIVSFILEPNSNDSINLVLLSIEGMLNLSSEQRVLLLQLSAVLRMSFLLADNSMISEIKLALVQNSGNTAGYFIEKYLRSVISKISIETRVADILKLKYLTGYLSSNLKICSLDGELTLICAEQLKPNTLIVLISQNFISFEEIDVIENQLNQAILSIYRAYINSMTSSSAGDGILFVIDNEEKFELPFLQGFLLQYVGCATLRKTLLYKPLFDLLLTLADKKHTEDIKVASPPVDIATESQFESWLRELAFNYKLCANISLDDLIISNMIDLAIQKKYYDSAKLNYRFQAHPEDSSSVPVLLTKLKEDVQSMLTNPLITPNTLKKLKLAIPEITKIH